MPSRRPARRRRVARRRGDARAPAARADRAAGRRGAGRRARGSRRPPRPRRRRPPRRSCALRHAASGCSARARSACSSARDRVPDAPRGRAGARRDGSLRAGLPRRARLVRLLASPTPRRGTAPGARRAPAAPTRSPRCIERAHADGPARARLGQRALARDERRGADRCASSARDAVLVDQWGRSLLDYPGYEVPRGRAQVATGWARRRSTSTPPRRASPSASPRPSRSSLRALPGPRRPAPRLHPLPGRAAVLAGHALRRRPLLRLRRRDARALPARRPGSRRPSATALENADRFDAWRRDAALGARRARRRARARGAARRRSSRPPSTPTPSAPTSALFQDWRGWLEAGSLDFAVPMLYTTDERLLRYQVDEFAGLARGRRASGSGSAAGSSRAIRRARVAQTRHASARAPRSASRSSRGTRSPSALRDALAAPRRSASRAAGSATAPPPRAVTRRERARRLRLRAAARAHRAGAAPRARRRAPARARARERRAPRTPRCATCPRCCGPATCSCVNATRVLPARLRGPRRRAAARAEALLLGERRRAGALPRAAARAAGACASARSSASSGRGLALDAEIAALARGRRASCSAFAAGVSPYALGEAPLPPYIRRAAPRRRRTTSATRPSIARVPGAVAAPTAGLHFTRGAASPRSRARGVERAEVVLHVGPGTFRPLRDEDLARRPPARRALRAARGDRRARSRARARRGGRVVAVGTTTARVLETRAARRRRRRAGARRDRALPAPGRALPRRRRAAHELPPAALVAAAAGRRLRRARARARRLRRGARAGLPLLLLRRRDADPLSDAVRGGLRLRGRRRGTATRAPAGSRRRTASSRRRPSCRSPPTARCAASTPDELRAARRADRCSRTPITCTSGPGEEVVARAGGLHGFTGWRGPWLTDSGGYQVFSLARARARSTRTASTFASPLDGARRRLTPESAVAIQEALGADVAMVLDDCVPTAPAPGAADDARAAWREAMERSLRWAERCRTRARRARPGALRHRAGRRRSRSCAARARAATAALGFDGYAHGGLGLGEDAARRAPSCSPSAHAELPAGAPRYLMGLGQPEDLRRRDRARRRPLRLRGADAQRAPRRALHPRGPLALRNARFREDPASRRTRAATARPARALSRAYLRHLFMCGDLLGPRLATLHNLRFYFRLLERGARGDRGRPLRRLPRRGARRAQARAR